MQGQKGGRDDGKKQFAQTLQEIQQSDPKEGKDAKVPRQQGAINQSEGTPIELTPTSKTRTCRNENLTSKIRNGNYDGAYSKRFSRLGALEKMELREREEDRKTEQKILGNGPGEGIFGFLEISLTNEIVQRRVGNARAGARLKKEGLEEEYPVGRKKFQKPKKEHQSSLTSTWHGLEGRKAQRAGALPVKSIRREGVWGKGEKTTGLLNQGRKNWTRKGIRMNPNRITR